jgi:hypothetical protein
MLRRKKHVTKRRSTPESWEMTDSNNMLTMHPPLSDKDSEAMHDVATTAGRISLWMRGFWQFFLDSFYISLSHNPFSSFP